MKIEEFREENGATLVVATLPGALSFSAFLGVRTGSRDDPAGREGIAHLLEHLAFKGTARRPTFRDVAVELDRVGAEFNAFTGREWLAFYVRGGSAAASTALDVLVDMYTGSLVSEETVAREKKVVIEELRLNENDGRLRADDLMHQAMFAGTGLANPVGGTVQAVEAVDAASVVAHMARHFTGPGTVLGLAGDVTPALVRQARRLLRAVPAAGTAGTAAAREPTGPARAGATAPAAAILPMDAPHVHYVLSFPGWAATDDNRYAVGLLHTILGGGMLSRLFCALREERGLSYYVGADHAAYRDRGSFNLRAGVRPERLAEAVAVTVEQLTDILHKGITARELDRAISYARGRLELGLGDPRGALLFLLRRACTDGRWEAPEEVVARTRAVSADAVMEALRACLSAPPVLCCAGPLDRADDALAELSAL
ncbi:pitrilysin family protein [Microbispora sp. ZYX-F-249]|uniref:Pitrilysin family protein n=1 Tax=Microbispora maris TaxID=3144104 RepID=A0ABV0B3R0_9ACTN